MATSTLVLIFFLYPLNPDSSHLILLILRPFGEIIQPGTVWTCVAHIITAVIGAGVLSLAWSIAQLDWIGGPVSMLCFAVVTYVSAFLLSDCYRTPHPVTGSRNCSYMDAVRVLFAFNSQSIRHTF